jgi:hypothetical protein
MARYELTDAGRTHDGSRLTDRVVALAERMGRITAGDVTAAFGCNRYRAYAALHSQWDAGKLDRAEHGVYVPPGTAEAAQ